MCLGTGHATRESARGSYRDADHGDIARVAPKEARDQPRWLATNQISPPTRTEGAGDVEVEAQSEEVLGRVDPQRLLEDAERRVPGDVQREQAREP